jgi:hypothetical protein
MSGHTFFGERWYGFDDGMYAGARLLEILSREKDPSAKLEGLPDAVSTPELNIQCAEGEPHALVARLAETATFPGATEVIRIDGLRVEYPDGFGLAPCVEHDARGRASLRGERRRFARAHPERVPQGARTRASPAQRCRSDPVLTLGRRHRGAQAHRGRHLRVAVRRVDSVVEAHGRAHLLQARLPPAYRKLQGARCA